MLWCGNKTHTNGQGFLMSIYRLLLSEFDSGLVTNNSSTQPLGALLQGPIDSLFKITCGVLMGAIYMETFKLFKCLHINSSYTPTADLLCTHLWPAPKHIYMHENIIYSKTAFKYGCVMCQFGIQPSYIPLLNTKAKPFGFF